MIFSRGRGSFQKKFESFLDLFFRSTKLENDKNKIGFFKGPERSKEKIQHIGLRKLRIGHPTGWMVSKSKKIQNSFEFCLILGHYRSRTAWQTRKHNGVNDKIGDDFQFITTTRDWMRTKERMNGWDRSGSHSRRQRRVQKIVRDQPSGSATYQGRMKFDQWNSWEKEACATCGT